MPLSGCLEKTKKSHVKRKNKGLPAVLSWREKTTPKDPVQFAQRAMPRRLEKKEGKQTPRNAQPERNKQTQPRLCMQLLSWYVTVGNQTQDIISCSRQTSSAFIER